MPTERSPPSQTPRMSEKASRQPATGQNTLPPALRIPTPIRPGKKRKTDDDDYVDSSEVEVQDDDTSMHGVQASDTEDVAPAKTVTTTRASVKTSTKAPKKAAAPSKSKKPVTARNANLMDATIHAMSVAVQAQLKLRIQVLQMEIAHQLSIQDAEAAKQATIAKQTACMEAIQEIRGTLTTEQHHGFFESVFLQTHRMILEAEEKVQAQITVQKTLEYKLRQAEERTLALQRAMTVDEETLKAKSVMDRWVEYTQNRMSKK